MYRFCLLHVRRLDCLPLRPFQLPVAAMGQICSLGREPEAIADPGRLGPAAKSASDEDSDDEDVLPPPAAYLKRGPRQSVSAEAYGAWNPRQAYQAVENPKSEEQRQRIRGVIAKSFLFNALEKEDVDVLVGAMVERTAAADERIIREGDDGDVMFVIERGLVECLKLIDGSEIAVKRCEAGDFFGELALLYNCPRAASVEAREDTVLWQLGRSTFNHIVRDGSIKKRERYEDFIKSVPLLETLGSYERAQLADSLQTENVESGTLVLTQGLAGDRFYLVEEGELVAQKDGIEVKSYRSGGYFGELALIRLEARAASVMAQSPCKLLWVDRKTFTQLLGSLEALMNSKAKEYA